MISPEPPQLSHAPANASGAGPTPRREDFLHRLGRELRIGIPLAFCITAILSLLTPHPFLNILTYSLCIGIAIQGLIAIGRYGMSDHLRRRFPNNIGSAYNWPGWPLMAPWVAVSAVTGYYGGRWLGDLLTGAPPTADAARHDPRTIVVTMAIVLLISMGCTFFFYARGRMTVMQVQAQSALRLAAENQLKLLASQLEPHMLFNTLANLRVLIRLDPPRAEAMLDHLIAFLRATLAASQTDTHSLSAEFARIDDYMALMQVRMGPRLQSRLDLPSDLVGMAVPPLLLQPLVENAIKHGLEPKVEGGRIDITARRQGEVLVLTVRDTGVGLTTANAAGSVTHLDTHFGMYQVRERLKTLYGNTASVTLASADDVDGGAMATLRMPIVPMTVEGTAP